MPDTPIDRLDTSCAIVGGGPAGVILALLLARQNIDVTLLEAHHDFDRDFRGDTIHPATLEFLDQLGLADRLLQLPHGKLQHLEIISAGTSTPVVDLTRLKSKYPYVAVMPQVKLLDFLIEETKKLPTFRLILGANVQQLVREDGVTKGVIYRGADDQWHEVRSPLTVAADGRFSKVRSLVGITPVKSAPPMDVLWFRLPRHDGDPRDRLTFYIGGGVMLFLLDRGDQWQVGYVIMKGTFSQAKGEGIESIRANLAKLVPWFASRENSLEDWKQVAVLSVESSRCPTWHQPGLLLIGDAAHAMSPVGGVGINYAIQDAIEAANQLTTPLKAGTVTDDQLAGIQKRREPAVKMIQRIQELVQENVVRHALAKDEPFRLPWIARVMLKLPFLRDVPGRIIAFGPYRSILKDPASGAR